MFLLPNATHPTATPNFQILVLKVPIHRKRKVCISFRTNARLNIRSKTNLIANGVHQAPRSCTIFCLASRRQGFGPEPSKKEKRNNDSSSRDRMSATPDPRESAFKSYKMNNRQVPELVNGTRGKVSDVVLDRKFMQKLEEVKRSTLEQKKVEEEKLSRPIEYDSPIDSEQPTIGFGTKVGVGIAVVVFGLVFALGDFLPSGSDISGEKVSNIENTLTKEEKATLESKLQKYQATLSTSPKDVTALEGAAVTLTDLGEYKQAQVLLEWLIKERPKDSNAYRLLAEVKYELSDYEGSAVSYKNSLSASGTIDFESLRGLTNALLAAKKPNEAVQFLQSYRANLDIPSSNGPDVNGIDPIQVELLLGKAYSDWGHVSDAVSVYDRLISVYPDDFRGYLAKGIILKENGKVGDAERMLIQARFFAPEKAKSLVDRYSRK
ncbi:hypothetical protein QJS04_geneDACA004461 [Acorus gramineus]|uniref:Uncharacterized protein n=1 Tax=Acorus gramineus TaxID=55184 RepID=A0AAV9B7N4_ACOGR|nr:hypothetical protein QJS04_geneDACA004461 [Acorus gramineus]